MESFCLTKRSGAAEGREKKTAWDGYFTLEAAMIVPVVFMLIVMLLYLMFYMYDRCVMTQDLYTAAYHESVLRGKGGDAAGTQVDESHYFMLSACSASVRGGSTAEASCSGTMHLPFSPPFGSVRGKWELKVTMKARKTDPPAGFRRFRRILAVAAAAADRIK